MASGSWPFYGRSLRRPPFPKIGLRWTKEQFEYSRRLLDAARDWTQDAKLPEEEDDNINADDNLVDNESSTIPSDQHESQSPHDQQKEIQATCNQEQESQALDASIQRRVESLVHASKCRKLSCSVPSCRKIKLLAKHSAKCKLKKEGGCGSCKNLVKLRIYHATYCQDNNCPLPFCLQLKKQKPVCHQDLTRIPELTSHTENDPQKSFEAQSHQPPESPMTSVVQKAGEFNQLMPNAANSKKLHNLKTAPKKKLNCTQRLKQVSDGKNPESLRLEALIAPRLKRMQTVGTNNAEPSNAMASANHHPSQNSQQMLTKDPLQCMQPGATMSSTNQQSNANINVTCTVTKRLRLDLSDHSSNDYSHATKTPSLLSQDGQNLSTLGDPLQPYLQEVTQLLKQFSDLAESLPSLKPQPYPSHKSPQFQAEPLLSSLQEMQEHSQGLSLSDCTESVPQPPPRMLIQALLQKSPEFLSENPQTLSKHEEALLVVLESNPSLMAVLQGQEFPLSCRQFRLKGLKGVRAVQSCHAQHSKTRTKSLQRTDMHTGLMLGLEAGMLIGLQAKQFSNTSMMADDVRNGPSVMDENGLRNLVNDMQQAVVPHLRDQLLQQQRFVDSVLCRQLHLQQKHADLFVRKKAEDQPVTNSQRTLSSKKASSSASCSSTADSRLSKLHPSESPLTKSRSSESLSSKKVNKDGITDTCADVSLDLNSHISNGATSDATSSIPTNGSQLSPHKQCDSGVPDNAVKETSFVSLPSLSPKPSSDFGISKETLAAHAECTLVSSAAEINLPSPSGPSDGGDERSSEMKSSGQTMSTEVAIVSSPSQQVKSEIDSFPNVCSTSQSTDKLIEARFEPSSRQALNDSGNDKPISSPLKQEPIQGEYTCPPVVTPESVNDATNEESVSSSRIQVTLQDENSCVSTIVSETDSVSLAEDDDKEPTSLPATQNSLQQQLTCEGSIELEADEHFCTPIKELESCPPHSSSLETEHDCLTIESLEPSLSQLKKPVKSSEKKRKLQPLRRVSPRIRSSLKKPLT